jgi:hypothetical protein
MARAAEKALAVPGALFGYFLSQQNCDSNHPRL